MKRLSVASLNFSMPLPGAEELEWNSHRSLLEFDIIVVEPTLRDLYAFENYNGTPLFSKERSLSVRDSVSNWKSQIKTAYEEGKTIIVSLTERESYFYYTGEVAWSGSGRNSRQTNSISPISNFDMLPSLFVPSQKTVGFKTVPVADDGEFKDRWRSIEDTLQYQFFFTAPNAMPLAVIDAMFSVGGKRCLGEVEGKDAKPIDVAKISQLSRCLNEDFDRAEISEFAKGILFGNPFRMTPLAERPEGFTNKVVIAAERSAISLVYTYQIFDVLRRARATASLDEASAFMSALVDHPGGLFLWPPMDTN